MIGAEAGIVAISEKICENVIVQAERRMIMSTRHYIKTRKTTVKKQIL